MEKEENEKTKTKAKSTKKMTPRPMILNLSPNYIQPFNTYFIILIAHPSCPFIFFIQSRLIMQFTCLNSYIYIISTILHPKYIHIIIKYISLILSHRLYQHILLIAI
jgi:hypothetical protein